MGDPELECSLLCLIIFTSIIGPFLETLICQYGIIKILYSIKALKDKNGFRMFATKNITI